MLSPRHRHRSRRYAPSRLTLALASVRCKAAYVHGALPEVLRLPQWWSARKDPTNRRYRNTRTADARGACRSGSARTWLFRSTLQLRALVRVVHCLSFAPFCFADCTFLFYEVATPLRCLWQSRPCARRWFLLVACRYVLGCLCRRCECLLARLLCCPHPPILQCTRWMLLPMIARSRLKLRLDSVDDGFSGVLLSLIVVMDVPGNKTQSFRLAGLNWIGGTALSAAR